MKGKELLKGIQKKKNLDEKTILNIIHNLLLGLKHLHSKGIMHRDLKLENILMRSKDNVEDIVIVDFGLASFVDQKNLLYRRCGTPGFVAPEIIVLNKNERYNEKCDIFSIGVIFYFLLKGHSPFACENKKDILKLNQLCEINFYQPEF